MVFVLTKAIHLEEPEIEEDATRPKREDYFDLIQDFLELSENQRGTNTLLIPQQAVTLSQLGVSEPGQLLSKCAALNADEMRRLWNEIRRMKPLQKRFNQSEYLRNRLGLLASIQDLFIKWFVEKGLTIPAKATYGIRRGEKVLEHERIKELVRIGLTKNPDVTKNDIFHEVAEATGKTVESVKYLNYYTGKKKSAK